MTAMTARDGTTVTEKGAARQSGRGPSGDGNDGMTAFPDFSRVRARVQSAFFYTLSRTQYIRKCCHAVTDKITGRFSRKLRNCNGDGLAVTCCHCRHVGLSGEEFPHLMGGLYHA
jgi:hypothetical protein